MNVATQGHRLEMKWGSVSPKVWSAVACYCFDASAATGSTRAAFYCKLPACMSCVPTLVVWLPMAGIPLFRTRNLQRQQAAALQIAAPHQLTLD